MCWLSRFKVSTTLRTAAGEKVDLLTLLAQADPSQPLVVPVQVGNRPRVAAYLPDDALAKRQARLKEEARLDQRPLSARQTALAPWTLYLTNIAPLTFDQAQPLARTRWQIELLFKLWKSHGQILQSRSADPLRQQCEGSAKLLGVLVAHWVLLVSGWQPTTVAALDGLRSVRCYVPVLLRAFTHTWLWDTFFAWIQADLRAAPRRSKRRKVPLAFQLWQDFDLVFP